MKLRLLFFLLLVPFNVSAQNRIIGVVMDSETREPLPFVKVSIDGSTTAVHTNIDGEFKLPITGERANVRFSYVGYRDKVVSGSTSKRLKIYLSKQSVELEGVTIVPGINPAEVIMERVIDRKKENDHEQQDYVSRAYHKFYFAPVADSAVINDSTEFEKLDSAQKANVKRFESHYVFLIESISERKHRKPDLTNEKVLASRVSGMKNPMFSALSSQIQSFSFYEDNFNVLGVHYISPLKKGAVKRYLFILEDSTTTTEGNKIYTISFRPRKDSDFKGMEGVLYIDSEDYALRNVIAKPVGETGMFDIQVRQRYEQIGDSVWFPIELNTKLYSAGDGLFDIMGQSISYVRDVVLDTVVKRRHFDHLELEVLEDANEVDSAFWVKYRQDKLSSKEQLTYEVVDSVGGILKLDQKMKWIEVISTGRLPILKYFELEMDKLMTFNDYEGFRLGAGVRTDRDVSKWFSVGGYGAYGFQDKAFKYGGDIEVYMSRRNDLIFDFKWQNDVVENGGTQYELKSPGLIDPEGLREFFISRMDREERMETGLSFRTMKYFLWRVAGTSRFLKNTTAYEYVPTDCQLCEDGVELGPVYSEYNLTEASLELRWSHKEQYTKASWFKQSTGTPFPVVNAKYTHGFNGVMEGDFNYDRINLSINHNANLGRAGKLNVWVNGGRMFGNVPLSLNFNGYGVFRQWSIVVPNSFETMRVNEFYSDRFLSGVLNYNLGQFTLVKDKSEPGLIISGKALWGNMSNRDYHRNLDFSVPELGYYETGLVFTNLYISQLTGLGVGVFYRLGDYSFPDALDNIAVKLDARFSF